MLVLPPHIEYIHGSKSEIFTGQWYTPRQKAPTTFKSKSVKYIEMYSLPLHTGEKFVASLVNCDNSRYVIIILKGKPYKITNFTNIRGKMILSFKRTKRKGFLKFIDFKGD